MYSTKEIATILEVDERTVRNYITQGLLKAEKTGKDFKINTHSLNDYFKNHLNKTRIATGKNKKLTSNEVQHLEAFIQYLKNTNTIEEFITIFESKEFDIPFLEVYQRFTRNKIIKQDKKEGMTYKELATKNNLHIKTIEKILKNEDANK